MVTVGAIHWSYPYPPVSIPVCPICGGYTSGYNHICQYQTAHLYPRIFSSQPTVDVKTTPIKLSIKPKVEALRAEDV